MRLLLSKAPAANCDFRLYVGDTFHLSGPISGRSTGRPAALLHHVCFDSVFAYRYPFSSDLFVPESGPSLDVATFDPRLTSPHFFRGKVRDPKSFSQSLLVLSEIVRTHFFLQTPPYYLDPVTTASPEILRLEGFSACCSVYVRADLPTQAFDGETLQSGTTNVDFGTPMQVALAGVADGDSIRFQVGRDKVEFETAEESIVE